MEELEEQKVEELEEQRVEEGGGGTGGVDVLVVQGACS